MSEEPEVTIFREYLRIASVHPNIDYEECLEFLERQCLDIGLSVNIVRQSPMKPILIATWKGLDPSLPSLLLNSHMDVVAVDEDKWDYPPFEAKKDKNGNIYARGAQDMKCITIQHLEAIRRLKKCGPLKRTVHLSFVPEEEVGGINGMREFVNTKIFQDLNIGFALDEGIASSDEKFRIFYGEKICWQIEFICKGFPSHGALINENNVVDKVALIMEKMMEFRRREIKRLDLYNGKRDMSKITTVNLTKISGGIQTNIVPAEMSLTFDLRIEPVIDLEKLEKEILNWCEQAGGVEISFKQKNDYSPSTDIEKNQFVKTFKKTLNTLNLTSKFIICPGNTDSRFLRMKGVPSLGFSPMNFTRSTLHQHNEFLNENIFLKGINIFEKLINDLANI